MTTIDLTSQAPELGELLHLAAKDNVILRTADGKEYVLAEVDDFDREIALVRQQPQLLALLEARSAEKLTVGLDEVKRSLGMN